MKSAAVKTAKAKLKSFRVWHLADYGVSTTTVSAADLAAAKEKFLSKARVKKIIHIEQEKG